MTERQQPHWLHDLWREDIQHPLIDKGVIDFTGGADFWPKPNLRAVDAGSWIKQNWANEWEQTRSNPARLELCRLALQTGGPVLELAAGAGGGNLSPILHLSPAIPVIVNDLESRLLSRWRDFLCQERSTANLVFSAFDACQMPIAARQIACISSVGGLSSLYGDAQAALRECARVLQPGGLLLISEMVLTPPSLASLPQELRRNWSGLSWLLGQGEKSLRQAGFMIVKKSVAGGRPLTLETDGLAEEAVRFGLTLAVDYHYLVARLG